jgi:hypothetical protein
MKVIDLRLGMIMRYRKDQWAEAEGTMTAPLVAFMIMSLPKVIL